MLAERDDSPAAVPVRVDITSAPGSAPANRKRRTAAAVAEASPAPPDPLLSVSYGPVAPVFQPISEGSQYHTIEQYVCNHNGYRYSPAGAAPPGSALLAKTAESSPTAYRVSWEDRNASVRVTQDGLGLMGADGHRSARCNAPVRAGRWYVEVTVELGGGDRAPESTRALGSHVRLGWGRREAPLNGPVGLDGYSYGVRDLTGERVTLSRPRPYGVPFRSGDVVGMYIALPPLRAPDARDAADPAHVNRERIPIQLRDKTYFEAKEYPPSKEMQALVDQLDKTAATASLPSTAAAKKVLTAKNAPVGRPDAKRPAPAAPALRPLPVLHGSHIAFFVNGASQGVAFQDLYDYRPLRADRAADGAAKAKRKRPADAFGAQSHRDNPFDDGSLGYYPLITVFNDARVRINPGPHFAFPPPDDIDALLAGAGGGGADADVDMKPAEQTRTWRPLCERYAEYFEEQFALDALDEERAQAIAATAAAETAKEEKAKAAREKRRQLAQEKRRAKAGSQPPAQAEAEGYDAPAPMVVERDGEVVSGVFGDILPSTPSAVSYAWGGAGDGAYSPSPLRHDMASTPYTDQAFSPAPTASSGVDYSAAQSGYNSEDADGYADGYADADADADGDAEGGEDAEDPEGEEHAHAHMLPQTWDATT